MPYRPSGVAPQAARASTSEELQEESGRHSERAKVRKDKPYGMHRAPPSSNLMSALAPNTLLNDSEAL
jgi:hypothetical protein